MALIRKKVSATSRQQTKTANVVTVVTKIKVTRVDNAMSAAKKSFTGLIDLKKKISESLCEGKDLADIKNIRLVKPF